MLEQLIAFVESHCLPDGFTLEPRQRLYDDNGRQIAELDLTIRGKVGTASHSWLIECRDRPSHGPQGVEWIEQLVARRSRLQFDHVTAVSSTGFTAPARDFAKASGIEVREVANLSRDEFAPWVQRYSVTQGVHWTHLDTEYLGFSKEDIDAHSSAIGAALEKVGRARLSLRRLSDGANVTTSDLYNTEVMRRPHAIEGLVPNGPSRQCDIDITIPDEYAHVLETAIGDVRVKTIRFKGRVWHEQRPAQLSIKSKQYRSASSEAQVISAHTTVEFTSLVGHQVVERFHELPDERGTIVERIVYPPAKP